MVELDYLSRMILNSSYLPLPWCFWFCIHKIGNSQKAIATPKFLIWKFWIAIENFLKWKIEIAIGFFGNWKFYTTIPFFGNWKFQWATRKIGNWKFWRATRIFQNWKFWRAIPFYQKQKTPANLITGEKPFKLKLPLMLILNYRLYFL